MTYMNTPLHKNPCLGGHEIYNFGRPFHGHHYYTLRLYGPCPRVGKNIFQEIHQFYTLDPKITSPWDEGVMKSMISGLLSLHMLHTKFGKDWPSSFWVENVNGWHMMADANP